MTLRKLNKLWRPGTAVAIGVNLFLFPWVLIYMLHTKALQTESLQLWIYLYGAMCTLFASLAGIRQVDKNKQHEVAKDINMASLGYGRYAVDNTPDNAGVKQRFTRPTKEYEENYYD